MTDQARMEYIDSQIAKQRAESARLHPETTHTTGTSSVSAQTVVPLPANPKPAAEMHRQPAALGKLQEVDLGADARWRNEERTRRKIAGEKSLEEEETEASRASKAPKKVRLGPDGKPWRSRRKRRASEDVERDRIVEDLMRENRCTYTPWSRPAYWTHTNNVSLVEIYDTPVQPTSTTAGEDIAADDRIAEAFRQEFMDAASQGRHKKAGPPAAPTRATAGKKEEEVLKGPKLGGSRNARAAMRDMMLKANKK